MAFFDKLNDLAKNLGDKTNEAIETGKLTARVNSERTAAGEELKKIGQFYYDCFQAGEETDPGILELCRAAKGHYDAAAEAQGEIDRIRAENEAAKAAAAAQAAPAGIPCSGCGAMNAPGTRFCQNCGTRLDAPSPVGPTCPGCGVENPPGTRFCRECGTRLEVPAPRACPGCGGQVPVGTRFCPQCGQQQSE